LVEDMPDGLVVLDERAHVAFMNRAAEQAFGISAPVAWTAGRNRAGGAPRNRVLF
jgi:PAS domain-containing protein